MKNLPSLQIMAWSRSTVKISPQTHAEGISSTGQSQRTLIASRNSRLLRLKLTSRRGRTISHNNDPFSAARFSARLVFGGALSLILSTVPLSSSTYSLLTVSAAVPS